MGDVTLRRIGPAEWRVWRAARLAALRDAPEAFFSTLEEESAYDEEKWRAWTDPDQGLKVVAQDADGEPVGAVGGGRSLEGLAGVADLYGMWVAPQARGSGLADDLVAEVVEWAITQGCREIHLAVDETNPRAQAFYRRAGFQPHDTLYQHPHRPGTRYLLMTRPLPSDRPSA